MKYYAVRKGKTPGIYTSWPECEVQVKGFPGCEYKSFKTEEEANAYINNTNVPTAQTKPETFDMSDFFEDADEFQMIDGPNSYAFVDGSFNPSTGVYGFGGFLVDKYNQPKHCYTKLEIAGSGDDAEMSTMRNVSGEILGCTAAIKLALELNIPEIDIYYDYMGIEKWATGEWKRNKEGTIAYYDFIQEVKNKIKINFIKVKAHTGVPGNELADKLAKKAVNL